jgi:hypothetical protein
VYYTGAGDTHDTHDTHGPQGALFFRVPQQNLSIQVPKTCYARSTLVKKTVPQELGTCYTNALRTVLANAFRTVRAQFTLKNCVTRVLLR